MLRFLVLAFLLSAPSYAGDLPDSSLTPGVTRPELTAKQICATKWGKDKRFVTEKMKSSVKKAYGIDEKSCPSGKLEIDHLISRELGGADDVKNLWPQCYEAPVAGKKPSEVAEWGAHKKDALENRLHALICDGSLPLKTAQKALTTDWVAAYKEYVLR